MNRSTLIIAAALIYATGTSAIAVESTEDQAKAAAKQWLELTDAHNYGKSWDTASSLFKKSVTKKDWDKKIGAVMNPFGKVESRKLVSAMSTNKLPGAPDGEYFVIKFDTSFEKKKEAVETITPMLDNGSWKVSGYFIK